MLKLFLFLILILIAIPIIRYIRKEMYFRSEEFLQHKKEVSELVANHNEIVDYAKRVSHFKELTFNDSIDYSGMSTYQNTSQFNYIRDRNSHDYSNSNEYVATLQVVKRAHEDPIKYLVKYFDIKPTDDNLTKIQEMGENISRVENARDNLYKRERKIKDNFNPPAFIKNNYMSELLQKTGVDLETIKIDYPQYVFKYVSPAGNSSQQTTIRLRGEVIEAISSYLVEKIKYNKSTKAQRALMTNFLREEIKERDNYKCQSCGISIYDEEHLLLEIDHIIPVSKGGLSTPENLQTLCWKCNRTKSNKIA